MKLTQKNHVLLVNKYVHVHTLMGTELMLKVDKCAAIWNTLKDSCTLTNGMLSSIRISG